MNPKRPCGPRWSNHLMLNNPDQTPQWVKDLVMQAIIQTAKEQKPELDKLSEQTMARVQRDLAEALKSR